jgi:CBS domain-containing protein
MVTVRQYLRIKGTQVWTVRPDDSVYAALQVMANKDIGALLVLDGEQIVGIFSERDYARKVALHGKSSRETRVGEIMTGWVAYVRPEQTIEECMALMTEMRTRHLPVIEEGRVVGLISIGDVVKSIITEQKFVIQQLEHYIMGER